MNDRISELADQAWDYALDHETVNGKAAFNSFINKNFSDLLLEKLAELIVRECSRYIEDKFDFCGDEIVIAESVLKHFGVE